MNRLIALARDKTSQIVAGKDTFPDDDVFLVVRASKGRLGDMDPSIHHSTLKPQKLLKNDGSIARQIVESVRLPVLGLAAQDASFKEGARLLTVRSFLSSNAIRAKGSLEDIDWCSSNNSVPCAVRSITVPLLITAMGAHHMIRDSEIYYDMSASADKDFVVIEGATHGITPCVPCETVPGQYSNSVKNAFDYIQKWINARF